MTTMAQKGGFPQGKISGNPPAPDTGTVQLTPLTMSAALKGRVGHHPTQPWAGSHFAGHKRWSSFWFRFETRKGTRSKDTPS